MNKVAPVLVIAGAICTAMIGMGAAAGLQAKQNSHVPLNPQTVTVPGAEPLDNNASAGRVVFTFDDGPDSYTAALLKELKALHLHAVFFVFGWKAAAHPQLVRDELAAGDLVENHTWDHPSFTGVSTGTPPLSAAKIKAELVTTNQAIVADGAPKPTLYRPPFGDITPADNRIAASLGLRIVEPFSVTRDGVPVDSRDWTGASAARIVQDVTLGFDAQPGIHGGSIIGFHDAAPGSCPQDEPLCSFAINTIRSLPGIVAFMNRHHLGVTVDVPADTSGGVVPNMPVKG